MTTQSHSSQSSHTLKPGMLTLIRLLLGVAFLISLYLAWLSFSGGYAVGCGPDSGCQKVLNSRWAYWFGMPVSLFGGAAYLALFLGTYRLESRIEPARQRAAWRWVLPCALLVAAGALWFTGIQMVVLKRFCPFCLTTHACAALGAILLLKHIPLAREPEKPWQKEKLVYLPPDLAAKLAGVAGLAFAAFALGQVLHQPKSYLVGSSGGGVLSTNASVDRILQLFNGRIELNLSDVPVLGRQDAPHVMLALHDYTCHSCQSMHLPLKTLISSFSNHLAVVSLPLPLDSLCNPKVRVTPAAHSNACEYAKIGLTVWRAKPEALHTFEDWIFTPKAPLPLDQTRAYARELVGPESFDRAAQDPWVARMLETSLSIYSLNMEVNRSGSMPQFLVGTNALFGSMSPLALFQKVTNTFNLRWPPAPVSGP